MMESGGRSRVVRFAAFEFDPGTGELRKNGLRIKLNGQPISVLAMLIQHAGEVVTREELQKRLWPVDTYVDFEHSLNAAIKRLRAALRDSAGTPRFVETLPRQGYRFIAPLTYAPAIQPVAQPVESPPASVVSPADTGNQKPAHWWRYILVSAVGAALLVGAGLRFQITEYFWRSPIADARVQTVTDFDGVQQDAAVSRDGHFVAFLSDRSGQMDVWVTQIGSGQFHNLTNGSVPELVNPSIRTLEFSPDGSFIAFWVRKQDDPRGIGIWAVPTLGGQPRPYLEGAAEADWSPDGARLAYHTPGPGDPLYVSDISRRAEGRLIFTAAAGLHSHFPLWAPDAAFIYFVQGSLPDKLDIWRIRPKGGAAEQVTSHVGRISHPVLLDRRTLLYLASEPDGSGSSLYSVDVERRIPHRLTTGLDRYTSLAASADGRRLVVTRATPKRTLWRLLIADSPAKASPATQIPLTTGAGFSPRMGPGYLTYISTAGTSESIWKLAGGTSTELWTGPGAQIFGGPAIAPDGRHIAFSARQRGRTFLYVMQADGTNARTIADSLEVQGDPAWTPDGQSITSAGDDHGVPRLYRIPLDGSLPTPFLHEYSIDPAWSPDGRLVVYSGPDVGTTFSVKAVIPEAKSHPLPALTLTRGARHVTFLAQGRVLVFLRGDIQHKNLWVVDLETGAQRQLTNVAPDFDIHDFDISPEGHEVVLERVQERSDVVLLDVLRP